MSCLLDDSSSSGYHATATDVGDGRGNSKAIQAGANLRRAVRRRRDDSGIWHSGDRPKRFIRLRIRQSLSIRDINTGEELTVALAGLENVGGIRGGRIVRAPDTIVDMLAVVGGIRTTGVASLQAELTRAQKVVVFDGLDVVGGDSAGCGEGVGEHQSTDRVSASIGAVGVKFPSSVGGIQVDQGLVDQSGDLDVIRGLDELYGGKRAFGDNAGTVARLGAPCNHYTLIICNQAVRFRRTPEAEIIDAIDKCRLAERLLVFGGRVADVVTTLGTPRATVRVRLIR